MSAAGKRSKRAARRSKERERERALEALERQRDGVTGSGLRDVGQHPAQPSSQDAPPRGRSGQSNACLLGSMSLKQGL